MVSVESTPEMVAGVYATLAKNQAVVRRKLGRPLTLADKILLGHLADPESQELVPGHSQLALRPDRVALQDVLGQTVMLNFTQTRRSSTAVPTTVHCDHLIQARVEGGPDLLAAAHLAWTESPSLIDLDDIAFICITGASNRIPVDCLKYAIGKTIRLFPHADEAGRKAAARWYQQLSEAGALHIDCLDFSDLVKIDGHPVNDLDDFIHVGLEQWLDNPPLHAVLPYPSTVSSDQLLEIPNHAESIY